MIATILFLSHGYLLPRAFGLSGPNSASVSFVGPIGAGDEARPCCDPLFITVLDPPTPHTVETAT
jgi:hypothetical protein